MTQQEISHEILKEFIKTNSKPNHIIQKRWLDQLSIKLNPKERELINPAIKELINEGLIITENRHGFCLVLTEKGFETIYPIDEEKVTDKICKKILKQFADTSSKVNHIVDSRWINFNLKNGLNPKEVVLIEKAINNLVSDGLITTEDRHGFCLVLTQKGFDTIY